MLISLAMICSCQKQDSAAEQQLAQRKTDLDAREEALAERKSALDEREKALDERQKALDEREKSLAEKEKATMSARTNPTDVQDPAQVQAERDMMIQELTARLPDHSQVRAEKAEVERKIQEQLPPSQPRLEELQRERQRKMEAMGTSGKAVFPAAAATSPSPSPTPQ